MGLLLSLVCLLAVGGEGDPRTGWAPRRIYYQRDRAGFNNLRLQFESMVALAAVTNRVLVLPQRPSRVAHAGKALYFELDIWSSSALASVIAMEISKRPMPSDVYRVNRYLYDVSPDELPAAQDWYFSEPLSRIQHFECLKLSPEQRRVAASAVLRGLRYNERLQEDAANGLQILGLTPGAFASAHIRRGDFDRFRPQLMYTGKQLAATLDKHGAAGKPLLVATNAESSDSIMLELKAASKASKVLLTNDTYRHEGSLTKLVVDMLMLAEGSSFTGTFASTFTTGVMQLRAAAARKAGKPRPALLWTSPGIRANTLYQRSLCWDKVTTFDALGKIGPGPGSATQPASARRPAAVATPVAAGAPAAAPSPAQTCVDKVNVCAKMIALTNGCNFRGAERVCKKSCRKCGE